MRGSALLERGRVEEGMAEARVGLAGAEIAHSSVMRIHFLSQLGGTFGRLGYVSEGADERVSEAELHRSRGLLHLAGNGKSAAAEGCFRHGIQVARRQQALLLEVRCATALATLLAGEQRTEEARLLLEDVTGRFTQGHGTPVLQDASDLLERTGGVRGRGGLSRGCSARAFSCPRL